MKKIEKLMVKIEKVFMTTIIPEVSFDDLMRMDSEEYRKMQAWWEVYKDFKEYAIEQEKELDETNRNIERLIKTVEAQTEEIKVLNRLVRELGKTNKLTEVE